MAVSDRESTIVNLVFLGCTVPPTGEFSIPQDIDYSAPSKGKGNEFGEVTSAYVPQVKLDLTPSTLMQTD